MKEVSFFGEGEFWLRGGRGRGLADGDPLAGPATDGEAFEDVVVVGRAGLAARLARGAVLRRGGAGCQLHGHRVGGIPGGRARVRGATGG